MSRKGNCWDNAPMESFFGTLTRELVHHKKYRTREEARRDIFEYIEVFYNRERLHSALGYMAPLEYEKQITIKQVAKVSESHGKLTINSVVNYGMGITYEIQADLFPIISITYN